MKRVTVSEGAGVRLDRWLAVYLGGRSRSEYQALIAEGKILVNKKAVKPSYAVKLGDEVTIPEAAIKNPLKPARGILDILYEDSHIIVVNKPSGIAVHPGESKKPEHEVTLVNLLLARNPELRGIGDSWLRPGIVHRLDKLASGVMVIAKNQETFIALKNAWKQGEVKKQYIALVWGEVAEDGKITTNIARSKRTGKMVAAHHGGKRALTRYRILKHFTNATLLAIETRTGRTHQIRAHMKSIGHPIVGDPLYRYKRASKAAKPTRLFLHASFLAFPMGGEVLSFSKEPPQEFTDYLKILKEVKQ